MYGMLLESVQHFVQVGNVRLTSSVSDPILDRVESLSGSCAAGTRRCSPVSASFRRLPLMPASSLLRDLPPVVAYFLFIRRRGPPCLFEAIS